MRGLYPPLLCRYCKRDLDGGDAFVHFLEEAKKRDLSDTWALNEAKKLGWTINTKTHWPNYIQPGYNSEIWITVNNTSTCEVCPGCKGLFPLDPTKERLFFLNNTLVPFQNGGVITKKGAIFSPDKKYRYQLYRIWDDALDKVLFIMLNPSTADGETDDHTTKRCINLAMSLKFGGIYIVNLYAYRSTDPKILKELDDADDPMGPDNFKHIEAMIPKVKKVIYAWGEKVKFVNPVLEPEWLKSLVPEPYCFKKTKDGYPYHPRNVEKFSELIPFRKKEEQQQSFQAIVETLEPPVENSIQVPQTLISIQIDGLITITVPLPENKTKNDVITHIMNFFHSN